MRCMEAASIKFKRDGHGGYVTPDGRYAVRPITMGMGVNSNGGWSPGRREWEITAPDGVEIAGRFGPRNQRVVHTIYAARQVIASAEAHR
jgi:hypothetical protein